MMTIVTSLVSASTAGAHSGNYAVFNNCPSTNPEVSICLYNEALSGSIRIGKETTPLKNRTILQGGYGFDEATQTYPFFGATNGETLSKTGQPVPGGLAGLVKCEELSGLVRLACEVVFENKITGVNAVLELARPANEIRLNAFNLSAEEGVALGLPVKIHLENLFLGSSCYIGSSANPIVLNLTTGTTSPPAPNEPISGNAGKGGNKESGLILTLTGLKLVDNAFAVPGASGCGPLPLSELVVDPLINAKLGLPSKAGHNAAELSGNAEQAAASVVNEH